jgi:hypothetical protein
MSPTDQIQDLFDRSLSSIPADVVPSPLALHERLRRRQLRTRVSTMCVGTLAIAVGAVALLNGLASNPANAVTLYPGASSSVAVAQLSADQRVMTARLRAVGFPNATIKVVHGALVVTNGPKDLASPSSFLTSSPELLIRSVTCYAGAQSGPITTSPLPTTCSGPQYSAHTATPDDSSSATRFLAPTILPDPALSSYASTTPAQDAASPNASALLPILNRSRSSVIQRFLVGPTLLTLSAKVASATVVSAPFSGGWLINVRLNPSESQLWDQVASEYFHRQLAVDLNGVIVEAPLIQPDNTSFHSFDGQMQLIAATKVDAYDLAAALTTGPLAVPLIDHPGALYSPPDHDLQFVSPEVGWIVTNNDSILSTTDGGRSWTTSYHGSLTQVNVGAIRSIDFVNALDGWALLNDKGLISTRNGGRSWSLAEEPSQGAIMNYDFANANSGWALTRKGVLLRSYNAGVSWQTVKSPALGTSLCAGPSGSLWLGIDGTGNLYKLSSDDKWNLSLPGSEVPAPEKSVPAPSQSPRPAPWISCASNTAWLLYNYGEDVGSMPYVVERTVNSGGTWKVVTSSEVTLGLPRTTPGVFATVDDFGATASGDAWITGYCGPCNTGDADVAIATDTSKFADFSLSSNLKIHAQPVSSWFINRMDGWVLLQENKTINNGNLVPNTSVQYVIETSTNGGHSWHIVDAQFKE